MKQTKFTFSPSNNYLLVGYGITGQSIARFLNRHNSTCTVYDDNPDIFQHQKLPSKSFKKVTSIEQLENLFDYQAIFISPGIADEHPILQKMRQLNLQGISDIEVFLNYAKGTIIGITGSNGKSTVTRWLEHTLIENGKKAKAIGNIGVPVLDYIDTIENFVKETNANHYWVIELSSFQIQLTPSLRANLSTIINISEDHIDRHHSLQQYTKVKQRLLEVSEYCILNRDQPNSYLSFDNSSTSDIKWKNQPSYGLSEPTRQEDYGIKNGSLFRGKTSLLKINKLQLVGQHNILNALIVWMFAHQCGISDQKIAQTIINWYGLEHRFQKIAYHHHIMWINDSKSTNVGSMEVAIKSCMELSSENTQLAPSYTPKNIYLIVGGQSKNADFTPLIPLLKKQIKQILLFGQDAHLIAKDWDKQNLPMQQFTNLEQIITHCNTDAIKGDFILFSPGCASFDSYKNYQQRGQHFVNLVNSALKLKL